MYPSFGEGSSDSGGLKASRSAEKRVSLMWVPIDFQKRSEEPLRIFCFKPRLKPSLVEGKRILSAPIKDGNECNQNSIVCKLSVVDASRAFFL